MTKPRPFDFAEFRAGASTAPEAPRGRTFTADDLAAARAEGVEEGRRLAMETIAASEAEALAAIAARLEQLRTTLDDEIVRARNAILSIARTFLEEYGAGLASEREIALADDMLSRLTENSEDRRSARLCLNAKSFERLEARLKDVLNRRGVGDFVSLAGDPRLQPGEARLEWRGGQTRRGRAEIKAAIAALLDPLAADETEATHERT